MEHPGSWPRDPNCQLHRPGICLQSRILEGRLGPGANLLKKDYGARGGSYDPGKGTAFNATLALILRAQGSEERAGQGTKRKRVDKKGSVWIQMMKKKKDLD